MDLKDQHQPKMEKMKGGRRRNMKSTLCIPRLRGNINNNNNSKLLSPMSLLERFREAVFRLIMLSALSKATHHTSTGGGLVNVPRRPYYSSPDQHHSEAVADCIEFIKKSASSTSSMEDTHSRSSTASSSIDATDQEVLPALPIM